MITLADALKAVRRGIYKYNDGWRTLVIVRKERQIPALWDECKALMDASSMQVESARYATRVIQMERGGIVRLAAIEDMTDAFLHAGQTYTHIIWLYEPDTKVKEYVGSFQRSHVVPPDEQRTDYADW